VEPSSSAIAVHPLRSAWFEVLFVFWLLVTIKQLLTFIEPAPFPPWRDAATYVGMARTLEFSPSHPMGYPAFLRLCFFLSGKESAAQIVVIHRIAGAVTALFVFGIARSQLRLAFPVALAAALLYCLSPLNSLLERALYAETISSALLAAHLLLLGAFVRRQSILIAVLMGAVAAILPLFRTVFLYAGPLTIVIILLISRIVHGARPARAAACGVACAAAWLAVYCSYCSTFSAHVRNERDLLSFQSTVGSGRFLWTRVLPLLDESDLKDLPWGDELYQTVGPHRHEPFFQLLASPDSPTRAFLERYGLGGAGNQQADQLLRFAATRVIWRHPIGFARLVVTSAFEYLATPWPGYMELFGDPLPIHRVWTLLRPITAIISLSAIAWGFARRSPEAWFAAVLGLFHLTYAVFAATASDFVERYYQPMEVTSALLLAGAAAVALGRSRRANAYNAERAVS
jgi:hypothetical protein